MTLVFLGIIVGVISGFFGVGGGMLLVPLLVWNGFLLKQAIAISIMQMVFSSTFGTILNYKKQKKLLKDGITIGLGGFIGGAIGGFMLTIVDALILKSIFIGIIFLAIFKLIFLNVGKTQEPKQSKKYILFFIGIVVGAIAMSIGVGGAVMITPILAGFLKYELKYATSLGLFFVIFSSIAGFISLSFNHQMLFNEGLIVGVASLFGVFGGIYLKKIIHITNYKYLLLSLYIFILAMMLGG